MNKQIKYKLKRSKICSKMLELGMESLRVLGMFNKKRFKGLKDTKKVILVVSPTHGNLGDHAIAYATKAFMEKNMTDYKFMELSITDTLININNLKQIITEDDIILTNGGGNIGDLYKIEEYSRRIVIKNFTKCKKLISMPQSMSFSNTPQGIKELEKTKKIYNANKKLVLIARENTTHKLMKEAFSNTVIFTPDIVLSLNKQMNLNRENILLCLRQDEEGVISEQDRIDLQNLMQNKYENIIRTDTVVDRVVPLNERDEMLNNEWTKFNKARLVVTDRLHGTIFAAITGTPALIIRTYNHKIIESIKWLNKLEYIKMLDDNSPKTIYEEAQKLLDQVSADHTVVAFDKEYDALMKELLN